MFLHKTLHCITRRTWLRNLCFWHISESIHTIWRDQITFHTLMYLHKINRPSYDFLEIVLAWKINSVRERFILSFCKHWPVVSSFQLYKIPVINKQFSIFYLLFMSCLRQRRILSSISWFEDGRLFTQCFVYKSFYRFLNWHPLFVNILNIKN